MALPAFGYRAARSIDEACELLSADEDACILAGGQSLLTLMSLRLAAPSTVIDLAGVPGLTGIDVAGDEVRLGCLVTHRAIEDSPLVAARVPLMAQVAQGVAHPQIRSRGTLGGSLAHADPAGDWPVALLALDGAVQVRSATGGRRIAGADLFRGPFTTSLEPDEIITHVVVPIRPSGWSYQKPTRRRTEAAVGIVAVTLHAEHGTVTEARVAVGAAVSTPVRVAGAEAALAGRALDPGSVPAAAAAAAAAAAGSLSFVDDAHGSAPYRQHLVRVLVDRAVRQAAVGSAAPRAITGTGGPT